METNNCENKPLSIEDSKSAPPLAKKTLTEKEQNMILKFVEEPSLYTYLILLCESKYSILETIVNRCVAYSFAPYTKKDLIEFIGDGCENVDELLDVCTTPGQIRLVANYYGKLAALCTAFQDKLARAPSSSILLTVVDNINYKDEYDKFDFMAFLKTLKNKLYEYYKEHSDKLTLKLYNIVLEHTDRLVDTRLDKKAFMEHLLSTMWLAIQETK